MIDPSRPLPQGLHSPAQLLEAAESAVLVLPPVGTSSKKNERTWSDAMEMQCLFAVQLGSWLPQQHPPAATANVHVLHSNAQHTQNRLIEGKLLFELLTYASYMYLAHLAAAVQLAASLQAAACRTR
jgi:hypothetical protein